MITLTDQDFQTIVDLFRTRYGINLSKKRVLVEGRLVNMLKERGISSFAEYIKIVLSDASGKEMTTLVNKITTNHTYFMREIEHFNFLKNTILPHLEQISKDRVLRIWSAGCSSGEEAYSMAMVIDDYFGSRKTGWDTTILATDISNKVLDIARKATYDKEALHELPESWQKKYFVDNKDGSCTLTDQMKKEVVFRELNLMDDFTFKKPFDLISCRNVMIYFEADTKVKLVNRFYRHTANNGHFFIGHSESINKNETDYRFVRPAIYKKELFK